MIIIKRIQTLILGAMESVYVDFIGQNKVKTLDYVKICQNCMRSKFIFQK